jgi:hypothetical protein
MCPKTMERIGDLAKYVLNVGTAADPRRWETGQEASGRQEVER